MIGITRDRVLVHVHADVNRARLCHGLPSLIQRCALEPTLRLDVESLYATHGNTEADCLVSSHDV